MKIDTAWALRWMSLTAEGIAANREQLTQLDQAIGDGDHGENMYRGFAAVTEALSEQSFSTPAQVMQFVGKTLISTVGGAAGPLYGTAFLRAGAALQDKTELNVADLVMMFEAATAGVQTRGKASVGEKTMVDVLAPAAIAAAATAADNSTPIEVLATAAASAWQGASDTEPMEARKGRASYLGARSIGHRDPGAQSSAIIFQAAWEAAQ